MASWDPKLHPRWPAGTPGGMGGKYMPKTMAGTPQWISAVNAQIAKSRPGLATPAPAKAAKAAPQPRTPRAKKASPAAPAVPPAPGLPFGETAAQREKRVLGLISANRHLDTEQVYYRGGRWASTRAKQHQAIVNALMRKHQNVPANRKAIMAGGVIGAGKTSALRDPVAGVKLADYISINADEIKEEMAARGMAPKISGHPDLSPMDMASLMQRESLHIAEMWLARAVGRGKNVIFDASMSAAWPTQSRIGTFKQANYHLTGVFVDVPVDVAARRSTQRYGQAHLDWMAGKGQGGRPIPSHLILGQRQGSSSYNLGTFKSLQGSFDDWQIFDNSGAAPRLVSKK